MLKNLLAQNIETNLLPAKVDLSGVVLGETTSQVIGRLGSAAKEEKIDEFQVFWYNSLVPHKTDYAVFTNDRVLVKSSFIATPKTLEDYITEYGVPEVSRFKYQEFDSYETTVHVWPQKGISIETLGMTKESRVTRVSEFAPMPVSQYFNSWGRYFKNNTEVIISDKQVDKPITEMTFPTPLPLPKFTVPFSLLSIQIMIIAILVSILLSLIVIKRHNSDRV